MERMKKLDEITILEVLDISSEELIEKFADKIEDKFDELFGNLLTPFIITPDFFSPLEIGPRTYIEENGKYNYNAITGNPLYFLFDKIEFTDINDLKNNDIIYIKGVKEYSLKHLSGDSIGWNVICYKPTIEDELKFVGFGPNEFQKPLTFNEVKKLLIDGYNLPQNEKTKKIIKARIDEYCKKNNQYNQYNYVEAINSLKFEDDKKNIDSQIEGINLILRLNQDKLSDFIEKTKQEWYNEKISDMKKLLPQVNLRKINLLLKSFSFETQQSTFQNYIKETPEQLMMWNYMTKFYLKVLTKTSDYGPIGFILSGTPGIGKTHLSVSVAKLVAQYNKLVTFVDAEYISKEFEKSRGNLKNFDSWFNNSDLIILDDINDEYGISSLFLQQAFRYVILNNKSILFTSNNTIKIIQKYLPYIYGYNSQYAKNFIAINNLTFTPFEI
jgi:DNA replication protein DnaC